MSDTLQWAIERTSQVFEHTRLIHGMGTHDWKAVLYQSGQLLSNAVTRTSTWPGAASYPMEEGTMRVIIGYRDQMIYIGDTRFMPSEDVWASIRTVLSTLSVHTNGTLQFTAAEGIRFFLEETLDETSE